jgi:hypothetical protein
MSEPLPDVATFLDDNGNVVIAANKKARRFLNNGFEAPPPRWRKIADTPGNVITSPEYRVLTIEGGGASIWAMLWMLHDAKFTSLYWCKGCALHHLVNEEMANIFQHAAITGAVGTMPTHRTVQ